MKFDRNLIIAVVALCALAGFIGFSLGGPRATKIELSLASPPTMPPVIILPCEGKDTVGSLADLMAKRINPGVTRISFALHHDERPVPERMDDIAQTSALLMGCIRSAGSFTPLLGLDKMADYYRSLDEMQAHTLAVQIAALEGDEPGAKHWFGHLKQECAACHSRFRPSTDASLSESR